MAGRLGPAGPGVRSGLYPSSGQREITAFSARKRPLDLGLGNVSWLLPLGTVEWAAEGTLEMTRGYLGDPGSKPGLLVRGRGPHLRIAWTDECIQEEQSARPVEGWKGGSPGCGPRSWPVGLRRVPFIEGPALGRPGVLWHVGTCGNTMLGRQRRRGQCGCFRSEIAS